MDGFHNYCLVCERLIVPPADPESDKALKSPKKKAAGSIRVSLSKQSVCVCLPDPATGWLVVCSTLRSKNMAPNKY